VDDAEGRLAGPARSALGRVPVPTEHDYKPPSSRRLAWVLRRLQNDRERFIRVQEA